MTIQKLSRSMFILAATALAFQAHAQSAKPEPRHPKDAKFSVVQSKPASNKWLLDADSDTERFRRIELVTSGYDIPMIEVGTRYEELVGAVSRSNWDLASYQIEKITARLKPRRRSSAPAVRTAWSATSSTRPPGLLLPSRSRKRMAQPPPST